MPQSGYKRFGRFEVEEKVVDVPGAALEKTFVPEFMPLGGKLRASLFSLSSGTERKIDRSLRGGSRIRVSSRRRSHPGDLRWNVREKESALPGQKVEEETQPAFYVPRPDYVLMGTHGKRASRTIYRR